MNTFLRNTTDLKNTGLLAFNEEHSLALHGYRDRAAHHHLIRVGDLKRTLRHFELNVNIGLLFGRGHENLGCVRHFERRILHVAANKLEERFVLVLSLLSLTFCIFRAVFFCHFGLLRQWVFLSE